MFYVIRYSLFRCWFQLLTLLLEGRFGSIRGREALPRGAAKTAEGPELPRKGGLRLQMVSDLGRTSGSTLFLQRKDGSRVKSYGYAWHRPVWGLGSAGLSFVGVLVQ